MSTTPPETAPSILSVSINGGTNRMTRDGTTPNNIVVVGRNFVATTRVRLSNPPKDRFVDYPLTGTVLTTNSDGTTQLSGQFRVSHDGGGNLGLCACNPAGEGCASAGGPGGTGALKKLLAKLLVLLEKFRDTEPEAFEELEALIEKLEKLTSTSVCLMVSVRNDTGGMTASSPYYLPVIVA